MYEGHPYCLHSFYTSLPHMHIYCKTKQNKNLLKINKNSQNTPIIKERIRKNRQVKKRNQILSFFFANVYKCHSEKHRSIISYPGPRLWKFNKEIFQKWLLLNIHNSVKYIYYWSVFSLIFNKDGKQNITKVPSTSTQSHNPHVNHYCQFSSFKSLNKVLYKSKFPSKQLHAT